jgi:hypothetical protein
MIIRYSTYSFAVGAASYTDDLTNEHIDDVDDQNRLIKVRAKTTRRIVIDAWIQGDGPADLKGKVAAFEQAFSVDGGDFIVSTSDGVEVCAIRAADTETGIRVTGRAMPDGKGVEWVNKRTVRVMLEYEVAIARQNAGGITGASEYSQQILYTGTGGPRFVCIETMEGPPIKQQLALRTKCFCTQQGRAKGRGPRLVPPAPIYPTDEHLDARQISFEQDGTMTWVYLFERVGPFSP